MSEAIPASYIWHRLPVILYLVDSASRKLRLPTTSFPSCEVLMLWLPVLDATLVPRLSSVVTQGWSSGHYIVSHWIKFGQTAHWEQEIHK